MEKYKELHTVVENMYSNKDSRKLLFLQTMGENECKQVKRALKVLSRFLLVQWEGKLGQCKPMEMV